MISTTVSHSKCHILEIHRIENLGFLGISRCKFRLRFWLNLELYWGICVFRFGGYRGISSGICHTYIQYRIFQDIAYMYRIRNIQYAMLNRFYVCVYLYIYIHIYAYTHTYTHIHECTYTQNYIRTHTHTQACGTIHMCVCACTYLPVCICRCVRVYI